MAFIKMFRARKKSISPPKKVIVEEAETIAYEAWVKYGIKSIPVLPDLTPLHGFTICTFEAFAKTYNYSIDHLHLIFGDRGGIFYNEKLDLRPIILNCSDPDDLVRWFMSAAVGYTELDLIYANILTRFSELNKSMEDFTYFFTCPDPILHKRKIIAASDIIKTCKIPFKQANIKSKRLKLQLKKQKPPLHQQERL